MNRCPYGKLVLAGGDWHVEPLHLPFLNIYSKGRSTDMEIGKAPNMGGRAPKCSAHLALPSQVHQRVFPHGMQHHLISLLVSPDRCVQIGQHAPSLACDLAICVILRDGMIEMEKCPHRGPLLPQGADRTPRAPSTPPCAHHSTLT